MAVAVGGAVAVSVAAVVSPVVVCVVVGVVGVVAVAVVGAVVVAVAVGVAVAVAVATRLAIHAQFRKIQLLVLKTHSFVHRFFLKIDSAQSDCPRFSQHPCSVLLLQNTILTFITDRTFENLNSILQCIQQCESEAMSRRPESPKWRLTGDSVATHRPPSSSIHLHI